MAGVGGIGSCISDPLSCPGQIVGGAASDVASAGLKALADSTFDFLGTVLKLLTTFWMSTPPPDLTSPQSPVTLLQADLRPLAMFAMTVGLLFAAIKIMWTARSGQPGALGEAFKGIVLTVVVTGAGAFCVSVLLNAFDQWASAILVQGFDGVGVGKHLTELAATHGPLGSVFTIALYGLAALSSLAQFAVMLIRNPVVVLLCVAWPISAAGAVTKEGGEAFRRITAWLLSWSVYKLVAAIVYATAFAMVGDSRDELGTVEGGLLLVVAILALPSLLRLITPAAQAISSGGGQLMMVGASAGGQMLGAAAITRTGQAVHTHQVGKPTPFSPVSGGSPVGSASTGGHLPPSASGGRSPGTSPPGGTSVTWTASGAGAGGAIRAGAAAIGPTGAGVAAASQVTRLAQQQAAAATGATDSATGDTRD